MKLFSSDTKLGILKRCLHILGFLQNKNSVEKLNATTLTKKLFIDDSLFKDERFKDTQPTSAAIAKNMRTILKPAGLIESSQGKDEWKLSSINVNNLKEIAYLHSIYTTEDFQRKRAVKNLVSRRADNCLWVFTAIYFARLEKKKINFEYAPYDGKEKYNYTVNPYFIILINNNFYLYCKKMHDSNASFFLLYKIANINILNENFKETPPSPDSIIKKTIGGAFSVKFGLISKEKEYHVRLKFNNTMKDKIENLLSEIDNLKIIDNDNTCEAFFTIYDDMELCKQIFYFGSDVEIIEPKELRKLMKDMLEDSLSRYI